MRGKVDDPSPALDGKLDPHANINGGVILLDVVTPGAGEQPERVHRRRRLPFQQEAVDEPGELLGGSTVVVEAPDAPRGGASGARACRSVPPPMPAGTTRRGAAACQGAR